MSGSVADWQEGRFFSPAGANRLLAAVTPLGTSRAKIFTSVTCSRWTSDEVGTPDSTGAALIVPEAQSRGLKTFADAVSEDSDRVPAVVVNAALPTIDYFFLNGSGADHRHSTCSGQSVCGQASRAAGVLIDRGNELCIH